MKYVLYAVAFAVLGSSGLLWGMEGASHFCISSLEDWIAFLGEPMQQKKR